MVRADKWRSLVEAASRLFYQQGFEHTSLADIAAAAEVPLGNVYYYFKAREELLKAVLQERLASMRAKRAELEKLPDPRERLLAFVAGFEARAEESTAFGCPVGGLCQEMNKHGGAAAEEAAALLRDIVDWTARQFRAMGFDDAQAHEHATRIAAARQGSILLSNTFKDPRYIRLETARLKEWLSGLPAGKARRKK
jgi:TetR/AcrR family transcriptional repressor of nem operon